VLLFACAFIVPVSVAVVCGPHLALAAASTGALLACVHFRRDTRAVFSVIAGTALFFARLPSVEPPWIATAAPRSAVVLVEGTVATPCRETRTGVLVPLERGPWIAVPGTSHGPLPGTRIRALGRLNPSGRVVSVGAASGLVVTRSPDPLYPPALVERARRKARSRLAEGLPTNTTAILRALLLGDRLPPADRDRMARTGTLHFFAVSGLHLALLATALSRLFGPRAISLLPPLILYAALSGFRTPVGRALLMIVSIVGARAFRRPHRSLHHLLLAATVLLALHPRTLTTPGFLLSFSAYAGIVGIAVPALARRRRDPLRPLATGLGATTRWREHVSAVLWVSASALAASLPATVLLFHRAAPGAILASLLIGPLIPLLLVSAIALLTWPGWAAATWVAEGCTWTLQAAVDLVDAIPFTSFDLARPHPVAIIGYVLVLLLAARRLRGGGGALGPATAVLLAALPLGIPSGPPPGFDLLPAGRGSALLFTGEAGHVLIDAGPRDARIAERLLARGVGHLERLIITHDHEDHAGGADQIVARLGLPDSRGAPPIRSLERLWPPRKAAGLSANDRSLVIRIVGRRHRLLATGDLETRGLRALLERGSALDADVLLLPHHGARNDALADLLLRAAPDHVWVSARPGFSHEASMLTVAWAGITLDTTWDNDHGCQLRDRPVP